MKKLKRNQMRHDVAPLPDGIRAAQFVIGIDGPVTPEKAWSEWTAGEGEGAAAARERMIARHSRPHSETAAEARENMIRRQGRRDQ